MMSHRGKRQAPSRLDDITPVATKRRKGRASANAEEEDASPPEQRPLYSSVSHISSDIKMSSIYNRTVTDAPAELFRKDLISAMKLPDSEPLTSDHYWVITDQWKQEWERGVQVPVKPDSLPGPVVRYANLNLNNSRRSHLEFKLPKNKYIRITKDEHFRVDEHYLSNVGIQAEKCCAYDLEDVDVVWLNILNGERALMGLSPINQDQLERVIEELEMRCWEKVHAIVKEEEVLALEFDESVICDVCRSPDSEDDNEMVFCEGCNICVHQACYGITSIPSGPWLCRTCAEGLRPECVLCPNKNGAMKSTRSGQKWAHVSCALWIPEVSIGCVEKMEPITKISSIPQSRWALICVLCRERVGACIQCSVKTCKTAYHVTCAFKHGLEMRAIIDEESTTDDDNTVKLRSYCQKHSQSCKKDNSSVSGSTSDEDVKKKQRKDMTTEEKTHARALKLQEIESEFEKHVTIKDITRKYDVDNDGLEYIYNYWVLKRRAAFNKPLIAARSEDASDLLNKNQEQVDQEKMRMFVQLRQDLERVRNLCYMVSRREKLSRTYQRLREQTFYKQAALLSDTRISLSTAEINSIKEANHGPSIYDRLYSHANAPDLSTDFETMVLRIAGRSESEMSPGRSFNGYIAGRSGKLNGDLSKGDGNSSIFDSLSSASDMDTKSHADIKSDNRGKINNCLINSQRKNNVENRNKDTAKRKKKSSPTALYMDSSSDDDETSRKSGSKPLPHRPKKSSIGSTKSVKKQSSRNHATDQPKKRFLGSRSASDSPVEEDEDDDDSERDLKLLRDKTKGGGFKKKTVSEIYSSDSDSSTSSSASNSDVEAETKSADSKPVPTKASVKDFTAADAGAGAHHRNSKDRSGSNGINKSVSLLSTSSSSTMPSSNMKATEKRRRVDQLFDEISDTELPSDKNVDEDDSEGEMFMPQRKSTKLITDRGGVTKSRKSEKHERETNSPSMDNISKKSTARKDVAKNDVFSSAALVGVEKTANNFSSSANYDKLGFVPQRAAAKKAIKAIEHIKNGMVKPATVLEDGDEALKTSKTIKSSVLPSLKKEQPHYPQSTGKPKIGEDDSKVSSNIDKRTLPKSTSTPLPTTRTSYSSTGPITSHTSATTSSSIICTMPSSLSSSNSCTLSTSQVTSKSPISSAVAIASPTIVTPTIKVDETVTSKKSPTPSSSSSSCTSSSSSSSSDSSSSGESSSSSNSSSSSGSSSSSSESEDDEKSNSYAAKPTMPINFRPSISTNNASAARMDDVGKPSSPAKQITSELDEDIPVTVKLEARPDRSENKSSHDQASISKISKPCDKDHGESKPSLASSTEQLSSVLRPVSTSAPSSCEAAKESYSQSVDDHSSLTETKAAIENLTNNEQNFLPSLWDTTTTTTSSSVTGHLVTNSVPISNDKHDVIVVHDDEDDSSNEKRNCDSPTLPVLPNSSIFSPMNNIDLASFDDMNENNNLTDSSMSLASLAAYTFEGSFPFKEDLKEDSAKETNKLVEKLKKEMARKKNTGNDSVDLMDSAPTPDIMQNHMDNEEDESHATDIMTAEKIDIGNDAREANGLSLDNSNHQQHHEQLQQTSAMSMLTENDLLIPESDTSSKTKPNNIAAAQAFDMRENHSVMLPKDTVVLPLNDNPPMPWSSDRRFDDGTQSSPYTQELANAPDRWSESVVLPSRRSDCSSVSVSSRSSSSSTYSEPANLPLASHSDDVIVPRLEPPTLELPQHLPKSVADLLRPATDNLFGADTSGGPLPEPTYPYDDSHHLPFVKSSFDSIAVASANTDKSIYDQASIVSVSGTQPSAMSSPTSLFSASSSMSAYNSVAAFTNSTSLIGNAFSQPLSIQTTRCVATASFTTTSHNMAIINSIISPVAALPPLHSDETPAAATPVSTDSVTFDDKFANSSVSDTSLSAVPSIEKSSVTEEEASSPLPELQPASELLHPSQPRPQPSSHLLPVPTPPSSLPCPAPVQPISEDDAYSSSEKEKENIFTSVADIACSTPAVTAPVTAALREPAATNSPSLVTKSPVPAGISPARLEQVASKSRSRESSSKKNHRNNNKTATNRRGRGRGRGRGCSRNANCYYRGPDDDIHSKLVGTVYDFDDGDDDLPSDNFTNLKAMRERRKSTDTAICDRFSTSSKDTCYSPKFTSPLSQHQPPSSKRKGSVASTPDRRSSHRSQPSPLCEIGNNVRILPKDVVARGDSLLPPEDDDDDAEDVVAEEEDDEEEDLTSDKRYGSSATASAGRRYDRRSSSVSATTTSPTLPQPPVQSSAIVDQFAAVQPVLPGPVDMRTYSGDIAYDTDTQLSSSNDTNTTSVAGKEPLSSGVDFVNACSTIAADTRPNIEETLEKEIPQQTSIPVANVASVTIVLSRSSAKHSPILSASPRCHPSNDSARSTAAVAAAAAAAAPTKPSPNHFLDAVQMGTPSVVLLDDDSQQSRNQLKMKIKGPYSNANYVPVSTNSVSYSGSSVAAAHQQLPSASQMAIANDACYGGPAAAAATLLSSSAGAAASSSANLPRMRKKELLLQYCSNINESGNNVVTMAAVNPTSGGICDASNTTPVKSGPSYKLPKAVASMTSIPTKEDYKAVLDAAGLNEKKKRGKDKSAAVSVVFDASDISNNNAYAANANVAGGGNNNINFNGSSNNNNNNNYQNMHKPVGGVRSSSVERKYAADSLVDLAYDNNSSTKRKSRNSNGASSVLLTGAHPKLKIKIGGLGAAAVVVQNKVTGGSTTATATVEEKNLRLRPPKKRLCESNDTQPAPATFEQLKREYIRFGSRIRSEFNANGDRYDGDFSDADDDNLGPISKQSGSGESSRKKRKRSGASVSQKSAKRKKKQQKSSSRCDDIPTAKVVQVITNDTGGEGAPKKLIIKFGGLNQPSEPLATSFVATSPPPPPPSAAKPLKSSKRNHKHELDSVRTTKITPIRLKLSRSLKGYVSKSSCAEEETCAVPAAATGASDDDRTRSQGSSSTAAASFSSSEVAVDSSTMLPNEASRATKTALSHSFSECSAGEATATAAAEAAVTAISESSATSTAVVCVSDPS